MTLTARTLRTLTAALALATSAVAFADEFPSKPIRIVSGFGAGGIQSTLTRALAEELGKHLKQSVVVEDKPGASGIIGAKTVLSARADGYTLHVGNINTHPLLLKNGIDLGEEMEPIGVVSEVPMVLLTTATKPLKTVAEVAAYAKANPGRLDFASPGAVYWNLMMALFAKRAGDFSYTYVPYKTSPDVLLALSRGDVHATLVSVPSAMPVIETGKATAVIVAANVRSPLLPDTPTAREAGVTSFTATSGMMLWAPRGTPPDVIKKLNAAMIEVARTPKYIESVVAKTSAPPAQMTPAQTREHYAAEVKQLQEAVRLAKYVPE